MLPLLARPKLLSIKNRWRGQLRLRSNLGRDLVLVVCSAVIMAGIYAGLTYTLADIQRHKGIADIHPSVVLGMLFLTLSALLLFSNSVTSLGYLFLGKDLELLMASPVSTRRLFAGKFSEILFSSSWMVVVFGAPVIIAMANFYSASWLFYISTLAVIIPFFVLPSAAAVIITTLFSAVVPAARTRMAFAIIGILLVFGLFLFYRLLVPQERSGMADVNDVLRLVALLKAANSYWTPPYWAATYLGEILQPTGRPRGPYLACLYSLACVFTATAYLLVRGLHRRAYSNSHQTQSGFSIESRKGQQRVRALLGFLKSPYRAMVAKDVRCFLRDMSQAIQLMLLLAICMLYLYNFRILRVIQQLPEDIRLWWHGFLFIGNVAMGSFVIAAVSTRFVFSAVSMEGPVYWAVRSSPMSLHELLKAKFWTWYVPVSLIASVLLGAGAAAVNAEVHIIAATMLMSWIICFGIVGVAVGLGAVYSRFDWEHPSELAASFGSLIYMVCATMLIIVNLLPVTVIIFLRTLKNYGYEFAPLHWYLCVTSCSMLMVYVARTAQNTALKLGAASLKERER